MEFNHKPVMLNECIDYLNIKPDGIYIDGTLGGAGHSSHIYKSLNEYGALIGLDQDYFAIEVSAKRIKELGGQGKVYLINSNFKNLKDICIDLNISGVEGVLLDLGVSSHQLDEAERGFGYQHDAPLDMRMDRNNELSAEIVVNEYDEKRIKEIIRDYGEEKWASRIAEFIVRERKKKRIGTTHELVNVIKAAIPSAARREGPHPAKRTFQAIRIEVNNELGILEKTIDDTVSVLNPGGRLLIITFHSLEDRIVKNEFIKKAKPCICPESFPVCVCGRKPEVELLTRKPIVPSKEELEENPRSRSAKLRVLKKLT
jgi:16S rRNA (cytosine1402-N4)-methyltransferase